MADVFWPSQSIGGRRSENLAAHLTEAGWNVSVLTLKEAYLAPAIDYTLPEPRAGRVIRTTAFTPMRYLRNRRRAPLRPMLRDDGSIDSTGKAAMGESRTAKIRGVLMNKLARGFPDEGVGWQRRARGAVAGMRFDVVVASLPSWSNALLARAIATRSGSRLVLDYRDPWTETYARQPEATDASIERHRRTENGLLRDADLLVGASPRICSMLTARSGKEAHAILSGVRDRPVQTPIASLREGPPLIVYAGSMSYGRSLEPFLSALSSVRETGERSCHLLYLGPSAGAIAGLASDLGVEDLVSSYSTLAYADTVRILDSASAALVTVSEGWEYQIPGKLFDMLRHRLPIMLIAPDGSDADHLVREYDLGWSCTPYDGPRLERAIVDVARKAQGKLLVPEALRARATMGTFERLLSCL